MSHPSFIIEGGSRFTCVPCMVAIWGKAYNELLAGKRKAICVVDDYYGTHFMGLKQAKEFMANVEEALS